MKKSILLYILIIFCFCFSFLFFSKKHYKEESNTLVFWTLQLGTFDKYIKPIIYEFEKENPNIKIKWIDVPYSEGEKRTLASILTDNPPDLVNLTPDFSLLLAQKNALYFIDENQMKQFLPSISQLLKYDNKYYGIPFYATSAVTLYNKLLTLNPIYTYEELFNFQPLKGSYSTMLNFTEKDTLLKLLNKFDINSYKEINSEKSIKLFSKFKEMYDKNFIPRESITQTHRDSLEKYMAGQLAYLVTGANFLNMIKENAPSVYKNTDVTYQLIGDSKFYDCSLMNFVIPKKAKNKEAALKFAIFLTNKKNQIEFAKLTTILPVNVEALEDEYFKNIYLNDMQSKARVISAEQLKKIHVFSNDIKNKKELSVISSKYNKEIFINNKNIKDVLDKFSEDWKKLCIN